MCMRTTLNIDDRLMREAKKLAVGTGQTLTGIVEEALRERLARAKAGTQRGVKLAWVVVGGVTRAGVDLSDRDSVFEHMEGRS